MKFVRQRDSHDCGVACLVMVCQHYGRHVSLERTRQLCHIKRTGVSLLGISEAAEIMGLRTQGVLCDLGSLQEINLPAILHWHQNHFVVLTRIEKKARNVLFYHIADPALGLIRIPEKEFVVSWCSTSDDGQPCGIVLLLTPTPLFYEQKEERSMNSMSGILRFLSYFKHYKREIVYIFLSLLLASILQLIFPFLTQSLVDIGIQGNDLNFITLILIAQFVLFLAKLLTEFIRSWLMLHLNYRISIMFITDYLMKLMQLPISFFDSKNVGDILQRISDNDRIRSFLTGSSISILFSFLSFLIFSIVLGVYSISVLGLFIMGNTLYIIWVFCFMKYRREIDNRRFTQSATEQSNLYQLVTGMQEIKLNNNEQEKRWEWERIQVKLYKIGVRGLALGQIQQVGTLFFSQATSIIISYIAARAVVTGDMTLGMMMALSYIIGQLSSPIEQFINFIHSYQDAKLSMERLSEVNSLHTEIDSSDILRNDLPEDETLTLENVSFNYEGALRDYVLEGLSLVIPEKKITAIVGASGSGKTTILKLLLGFYTPQQGEIRIGCTPLTQMNPHFWRSICGAVMQEGYIFSDSISYNIAMERNIDAMRLQEAIAIANLNEYINTLPLGINTKIGMEGSGLSQGQKQRILIARAVYKSPEFIFLDEATNSLDARNERIIMDNLSSFYKGRTVVIVAHRLSTVRNADNIIVLERGKIVESGQHNDLLAARGKYYELVQNQLELGL